MSTEPDDRPEYLQRFFPRHEPPPPGVMSATALPPSQAKPYALKALNAELEELAEARQGTRNDRLNKAGFSLAQLVAGGYLDRDDTWAALHTVALAVGLDETEVEKTLRSAFAAGAREPRVVAQREGHAPPPATVLHLADVGEDLGVEEEEFWTARPVHAHLHQFARSRRAAPWAVLGAALARVVVVTPPMVMLPPLVGTDASLNLFIAIVGASGAGKGAAVGAASDALRVGPVNSFPVGSGEGLTHLFVRRTKEGIEQHTYAVLANVGEVDTVAALNARQGSTLQSVLRMAYMGEEFGFGYADPSKRLVVARHTYRLALMVGVQPKRAAALFDDVDGGTPQRFVFTPAEDPGAPDMAPVEPKPWKWTAPALPSRQTNNHMWLPVCDTAKDAVDAGRLARIRGEQPPLDGHALLARLKVAAALALLDGRAEVGEDDWRLSATVMAVSNHTRNHIETELRLAKRATNEARADAEGDRDVIRSERVEAAAIKTVVRRVRRLLPASSGGMTHSAIRSALTRGQRDQLEAALTVLLDAGHIEVEETTQLSTGGGGAGHRYRASNAGPS